MEYKSLIFRSHLLSSPSDLYSTVRVCQHGDENEGANNTDSSCPDCHLCHWRTQLPWRYLLRPRALADLLYLLPVILRHPETQTTPAGGSETFVCTAQGDVLWYIDDRWLSSSYRSTLGVKGLTFQERHLSGYEYPTTNLTMTVPARDDLNGTEIHCRTAGSDGNIIYSNYSWLWIVGMSVSILSLLPTTAISGAIVIVLQDLHCLPM